MQKKELRIFFLQKRQSLSDEQIESESINIFNLLTLNFNLNGLNICTFLPIKKKNEINTFKLLTYIEKYNFKLFITKWHIENNELTIHNFNSKDDLITNKFGIPEPKEINIIEVPNEISIVLVPLLCFDKKGNRVGYGKGVYDQFLKKFNKSKTIFIGLSFFNPIDEISDINEYDVKLNYCITPNKIYHFEK
jgi:5-formyltetrahydrofolate cyclo-ligase